MTSRTEAQLQVNHSFLLLSFSERRESMNDGHFFLSHKTLPDLYGAHKTSLEVFVLSVLRVKGATYRERDEGEIFRNPAVVYEGVF